MIDEPLFSVIRICEGDEEPAVFVGRNQRDHEVFISHSEDGRYEGVSVFDSRNCREIADALHEAADWLDTLPSQV